MDRPQLFVSHHSSKAAVARQIVDELERRGVRCWLAPRDIAPGEAFDRAIAQALLEVDAILVLFCEQADASRHVRREVIIADEAGKAILPLRLARVAPDELSYWFKDAQWIDWLDGRAGALDRIARQVNALTSARVAAEAPPAVDSVAADMAAMGGVPRQQATAAAAPGGSPRYAPASSPVVTGTPWHLWAIGWIVVGWTVLSISGLLFMAGSGMNYSDPSAPTYPGWANGVGLVVALVNLSGGVLLLLKRRWATYAFGATLIASVLMHLTLYFIAGPLVVTGMALSTAFFGWAILGALVFFTGFMAKRGVLR